MIDSPHAHELFNLLQTAANRHAYGQISLTCPTLPTGRLLLAGGKILLEDATDESSARLAQYRLVSMLRSYQQSGEGSFSVGLLSDVTDPHAHLSVSVGDLLAAITATTETVFAPSIEPPPAIEVSVPESLANNRPVPEPAPVVAPDSDHAETSPKFGPATIHPERARQLRLLLAESREALDMPAETHTDTHTDPFRDAGLDHVSPEGEPSATRSEALRRIIRKISS